MDESLKTVISASGSSAVILLAFLTIILPLTLDNKDEIHNNNLEIMQASTTLSNLENMIDTLDTSISKLDDKLDKLKPIPCDLSNEEHC